MTFPVKRYWYVLWVGLVILAPSLLSQSSPFEGKRIDAIQYEPSPQPLAAEDLARAQPLKIGSPLRLADVSAAIDGLYATGRFEDIQVDATPSGADAVIVRFITTLTSFVGHVGISGKTSPPPNAGQLVNATQLSLGTPYLDQDLKTAQDNLKRLLEADGLYQATVTPTVSRDPASQTVNVTFLVKPGKRAKYTAPIIHGTPLLSDQTILRATGWRIPIIHWWRQVTQAKTRAGLDGIHKKYRKQDRLTARLQIDSLNYEPVQRRVQPVLTLDAGPKVQIRSVEAKVSKSRLKKYVPVYDEGAVDRDLLVEGAKNLRDYFQNQGYYDASVYFRILNPSKDQEIIEYVIARGARYKLVSVQIRGNKYFLTEDLRERMFLEPSSFQYRHGRYSEAFRKKDEETIADLYKANGFRDVAVTSQVESSYKGKPGQIGVVMTVEEGPQWFVDDLQIQGTGQVSKDTLSATLASGKGQPFSDVNVATDRNAIVTAYLARGFPNVTFEYKSEPSSQPNHVNLIYTVTENNRQFVRNVAISGLTETKLWLVEKQITLKPGDPLSLPEMTAAQRRLYNLGVFAKVNTAVQNPAGDTDRKRVLYDFEEAHRYTVNVGFGAEIAQFGGTTTSLNNPGGATGFSPRGSLEINRLNFLGIGHTISFLSRASDLEQRASINYFAPHFLGVEGRTVTYTILYDKTRDVRTFSSKREEASVQFSQRLSRATTALLRFSYRRVSTSDVVIPALLVPQLLQPVRLGLVSGNLVQDRRDDPTDAHRGIYNTLDAGLASNIFGSQRNFARVLAKNATYTPIGKKLIFARQTQFGVIVPYNPPVGLSAVDSVPLPERFFGGGANSHRGFAFNQAGPRDIGTPAGPGGTATQPTGFPLGGNALFFNTFELRFPLIGSNIGGVLFHDAGNVFRSFGDISFRASQRNLQDFSYMVHAVGFGIRYRTPVGPVRLDLAYAINPPSFIGFKGTELQLLQCNPALPPTGVCVGTRQTLSHFQFSFSIGQAF